MALIRKTESKALFKIPVERSVLDAFNAALVSAEKVGLQVDYSRDVEQLLKRLTRIISDAASEAQAPAQAPSQAPMQPQVWQSSNGVA